MTNDAKTDVLFDRFGTPVGEVFAYATAKGLRAVLWGPADVSRRGIPVDAVRDPEHPVITTLRHQLDDYFRGGREAFELPLDPRGTPFQLQVWQALREIPFGETRTYGEQARRVGRPTAARAVGAANGRNPLSIVVPCHRVIGASGALTGFAGGLEAKRILLDHERNVRSDRR